MKRGYIQKTERGFVLLEILLVAMVIFFLYRLSLKAYFKNPDIDKSTQKAFLEHGASQQGINVSNQQAILDSTKEKTKDLNKQILDREKQLEDYR